MPPALLLVAVGGAAGALARHGLTLVLDGPDGLPLGTLLVNVAGCLLLGVLVGARPDDPVLRPLLGTGFLGGLTTFSSVALQTDRLLADAPAVALASLALTVVAGLAAAAGGLRLGARLAAAPV